MTPLHRLLWAKSAPKDRPNGWKPVLAHLLDVAACAWELLLLEPQSTLDLYARDLGYPETPEGWDAAMRWTCALIALHDLGKASPAFQQLWPDWPVRAEAAARGLGWPDGPTGPTRTRGHERAVSHSVVSQVTLPDLLTQQGWDFEVAERIADAVGAHHGFRADQPSQTRAFNSRERGKGAWDAARLELYEAVCQALGVPAPPGIQSFPGGPFMRLAGLTSFADWIGSSFDPARFEPAQLDDPRAYFELACGLARKELENIGWEKREALADTPLDFRAVFGFAPRPLQAAAEQLLAGVTAPTLLLVEAPMGEGKTEAALHAHLNLQRQLGHRGLYIALPTQATGNAMFRRTADFLTTFGGRSLDLQLLHGGKDLNRDFQALRVQPNTAAEGAEVPEDAADSEEGAVRAREWFTVRKRALLSEYGVGTVDQALLGVLPVAHQFIRLWGLGNRTVVLDEVHAYDVYTGTLIEELVKWLGALGSSVILMSATLPDRRRAALLAAYGAQNTPSTCYPRLTRVSGGVAEAVTVEADPSRERSIRLHGLAESVDALAGRTLELHARGGVTAVIVNTVQRAQELRRALKAAGVPDAEVLLFHARARNKDRRAREERVLAQLGKHGQRPERLILLGTQVLEQSLDYDADVMLSDLAPLDLLLQRAGRLHRHQRAPEVRAGHAKPALHVAGLLEREPDLKTTVWGRIYQPWTLLRAWAILGARARIALPAELDELVQAAYGDADPPGLSPEVLAQLAATRLRKDSQDAGGQTTATVAAITSPQHFPAEPKPPRWDEDPHADDDPPMSDPERPGVVRTRLGDESVTAVPLFRQDGMLRLDPDGEAAPLTRRDFERGAKSQAERVAALHECSVRLGRWEVVQGLADHARAQVTVKLHWPELAALRDALPLVLDEQGGRWVAEVGGLTVCYDPELGVVYEKPGGST